MARYLIVATAGAGGDLQPLIAAALAVQDRGHSISFLGDASVAKALATLDVDVEVLPPELDLGPRLVAAVRDAMVATGDDAGAAGPIVEDRLAQCDAEMVVRPGGAVPRGVEHELERATALRVVRASGFDGGGFAYRAICSGGEALGADLLEWSREFFGCNVNEAYGQTELNGICGNSANVYPIKPGSLGRALPGTLVAILDDEGQPVVGSVGEIAIGRHNPLTMLEYWRNPHATAEKFNGDRLLTGDLGTMDEDGYVWFQSRKDDVINSGGYRIGPGEIEDCLGSHPAVALAAVIDVPDERRGQVPKAFVILRQGQEPGDELAATLKEHVRNRLAAHEVPREVVSSTTFYARRRGRSCGGPCARHSVRLEPQWRRTSVDGRISARSRAAPGRVRRRRAGRSR
jgi:AMP-binding enzyme